MTNIQTAPEGKTAAQVLAASLVAHTEKSALRIGEKSYVYRELLQRTMDYQVLARKKGIEVGDRVLFIGEPGLDYYASLLAGVLGSYTISLLNASLPVDVKVPLIENLAPRLVIADHELPELPAWQISVFPGEVGSCVNTELSLNVAPHAYLSITSGTTGKPTCALVDACGLGRFLQWVLSEFDLSPSDRWFEASDPSFDLAISNALQAFSSGGCLTVPTRQQRLWPAALAAANETTVMRIVPSVGNLMLAEAARRPVRFPNLRLLGFCGEVLPISLPSRILQAFQSTARTINTYGMTESAGFVLRHWFDAGLQLPETHTENVPIGEPIPGVQAWIESPAHYPRTVTNTGDTGELVIKAAAVALEIWKEGGRVSEFRKPYAGWNGELRTGDIVERNDDGYNFIGRAGRVVKIRGTRINLAQLDQLLTNLLEKETCILKHNDELVALVESERQLSREYVAKLIGGRLQAICIPRRVISLRQLPRTRSGKVSIGECSEIVRTALL